MRRALDSIKDSSPIAFRLAPMQLWLRILTWVLFLLPAASAYASVIAPPPVSMILSATTAFTLLVYASVWFAWRPNRFEIDERDLRIVWPVRSRSIPRSDVIDATIMSSKDFRSEYGYGMRIGAGGLWGGFGLLKTSRETFSMWISRTDEFVLVKIRGARTLLITPEHPERFVKTLANKGVGSGPP